LNISRAIDNLNDPNRRENETQVEYNARLAASARLIQDESDRKAEKKLYARRLELQAEAESLRREEKEYERRKQSLE
jgi:hypothetical protein